MVRSKKQLPKASKYKVDARFNDELYHLLVDYAKNAHMSKGEYIRSLVAGVTPTTKTEITYDCSDMLKIFRNLSNVTNNLNQIAKKLNQGYPLDEKRWKQIVYWMNEIMTMRDELKKEVGSYRGDS